MDSNETLLGIKNSLSAKPPSKSPHLAFINITNPSDITARRNQRTARSHVMKMIRRSSRPQTRSIPQKLIFDLPQAQQRTSILHTEAGPPPYYVPPNLLLSPHNSVVATCASTSTSTAPLESMESLLRAVGKPSTAVVKPNRLFDIHASSDPRLQQLLRARFVPRSGDYYRYARDGELFETDELGEALVRIMDDFAKARLMPAGRMKGEIVPLVDYLVRYKQRIRPSNLCSMWLAIAVTTDRVAFHLSLGSSAILMSVEANQQIVVPSSVYGWAMKLYNSSLQDLHGYLSHPTEGCSDATVGAVIAFTLHDDHTRYTMHMNGLERIIQLRGGIDSFAQSDIFRLAIYWSDMAGSLMMDTPPRFPLPHNLTQTTSGYSPSPSLLAKTTSWTHSYPRLFEAVTALLSLSTLAEYINDRGNDITFWDNDEEVPLSIFPTAYQFLHLKAHLSSASDSNSDDNSSHSSTNDPEFLITETIRLAGLLTLGALTKHLGAPGEVLSCYRGRIHSLLAHPTGSAAASTASKRTWAPNLLELRLWVLVIGGLVEVQGKEARMWHVAGIAMTMAQMGLETWEEVLRVLRGVVWFERLWKEEMVLLEGEVDGFRRAFG